MSPGTYNVWGFMTPGDVFVVSPCVSYYFKIMIPGVINWFLGKITIRVITSLIEIYNL